MQLILPELQLQTTSRAAIGYTQSESTLTLISEYLPTYKQYCGHEQSLEYAKYEAL